ncbi:hypothetical protein Y1Q_0013391 [Alligator mississippiensis]|uniref:Uncharacterized protein n=1 Tax=Alligator mississippiensis TaxID=8496 RepID=A0A151NWM5_ALLMI|nr:hypothetical protein Y1Q_0013391 [Alligator mississippiensis]
MTSGNGKPGSLFMMNSGDKSLTATGQPLSFKYAVSNTKSSASPPGSFVPKGNFIIRHALYKQTENGPEYSPDSLKQGRLVQ